MTIVTKPLSDLRLAEKNVRRHTDKQMREYVRSIRMFGQIKPILIDETGEIIAGNGLYEALRQMDATECECCVVPGLTEAQKKKLMLADNRVYELGITDTNAFEDILRDLEGDIDIPGWDADLLEVMTASVPDVDEMISDYGIFDQEQTTALNARQRENPVSATRGPLQQATAPVTQPGQVPAPPAATPPTEAVSGAQATQAPVVETASAETHRYIICPKCGERICL
ncbi:MAG: ParB/Srx family N-terminal domain-containing protein [Oscillospiraceae bacterium]|nr:ParB/Srx family N-terminal domain-containing protein [Oscillospiraceae bacterium]